jgi:CYTH domain-containing protein
MNEDALKSSAFRHQVIRQGYLAFSKGMTTRIRSLKENSDKKWFLTFKQKVSERVIEIEKKIDDRDGNDLWEVCVGKIKKDRYLFLEGGYTWELDLFKKGSNIYFIVLEIELPEGALRPKNVPKFLRDFVVYEVPLTDDRFSNKRLGDIDYASRLYRKIAGVKNEV